MDLIKVRLPRIHSRSLSEYKEFEYAFKYASVWLQAERQALPLVPSDYVGEMPLKNGFYTYRVGLSSANLTDASLVFELIKD